MPSASTEERKATKKTRVRTGGNRSSTPLRLPIAAFRGSNEFAEWFAGLTDFSRLPATVLIEHALVEYGHNHGYEPAPMR